MVVTFDQCDISAQVQHTLIKANLPLSTLRMDFQPLVTTILHSCKLFLVSVYEREHLVHAFLCLAHFF